MHEYFRDVKFGEGLLSHGIDCHIPEVHIRRVIHFHSCTLAPPFSLGFVNTRNTKFIALVFTSYNDDLYPIRDDHFEILDCFTEYLLMPCSN